MNTVIFLQCFTYCIAPNTINRTNYALLVKKHAVVQRSLSTVNIHDTLRKAYCGVMYHESGKILSYCPPLLKII